MRVTILHSEISANASLDEHETMLQVAAVQQALESLGFDVFRLAFNFDFTKVTKSLRFQAPDIVFNLVESIQSKVDYIYLAPLLLEELNLPYTGANSQNLFLTTNKLLTKHWLQKGGLPTPEWIDPDATVTKEHFAKGRYIVKSVCEEGSVGISQDSVVEHVSALQDVMRDRKQRYGGFWFAERYIPGREFNIAVTVTNQSFNLLSTAEIKFTELPKNILPIIDYESKWCSDVDRYHAIQRSFDLADDTNLMNEMIKCSMQCCEWFNLIGYYRFDIRVEDEKIWLLEINANPSIAPDAGFAAQAAHSGFSYQEIIEHIIKNVMETSRVRNIAL